MVNLKGCPGCPPGGPALSSPPEPGITFFFAVATGKEELTGCLVGYMMNGWIAVRLGLDPLLAGADLLID